MNPCITIDVSKETSHVQGFLDNNVPLSKPKKILHTKEGFSNILTIYNQIVYKTGIKPTVFFEYTGVYHKTLMAYLKANYPLYFYLVSLSYGVKSSAIINEAKTKGTTSETAIVRVIGAEEIDHEKAC